MRQSGFAATRLLMLVPVLISAFLMGFVAADWTSPQGGGAIQTLTLRFTNWLGAPLSQDLVPAQAFQDVLNKVSKEYYGQPPSVESLTYAAVRGMLATLHDPYTRFMEPSEYKRMQEDTRGNFVGIGAELRDAPEGARVRRPLPNSPAAKAGLKAGDVIIAVDGKPLKNIALDEIVRMIRGQRYTKVRLTVKREGVEKPLEFTITRNLIEFPTLELFLDDEANKIWRIALQNFNEKAAPLLDQSLREIEQKGCRGLILDLRYNPGGLLDSAIEVASRFIKSGVIVIVQGKQGVREEKHALTDRYRPLKCPLVVLVNGGSASASEIVAGALQDHKVATLIGEPTFGKGLVQTVIGLDNTAVAITTARYLTPNGRDINRKLVDGTLSEGGLKPDLEVKQPEDLDDPKPEEDVQLQRALQYLREKIGAARPGKGTLRATAGHSQGSASSLGGEP